MGWSKLTVPNGVTLRSVLLNQVSELRNKTIIEFSNKINSTFYFAVKYESNVKAVIVKCDFRASSVPSTKEVWVKVFAEEFNPDAHDCPEHVLLALSPTEDTNANQWRNECLKQISVKSFLAHLKADVRINFLRPIETSKGKVLTSAIIWTINSRSFTLTNDEKTDFVDVSFDSLRNLYLSGAIDVNSSVAGGSELVNIEVNNNV